MDKIGNRFWQDLNETKSTNDDVKILWQKCHNSPCVVTACQQTAGRGRRGRNWIGCKGNLFMSVMLCEQAKDLGQLVILSGLAVWHTVTKICPNVKAEVKWPNDVLVNGAKISGILFEHVVDDWWIMGVGINVVNAPDINADYKSVSLNMLGANINRVDVLHVFLAEFDKLYAKWKNLGFCSLQHSWLDKAYKHGQNIKIIQEEHQQNGVFETIDEDGSLMLRTPDGLKKIVVGDMFAEKEKNG